MNAPVSEMPSNGLLGLFPLTLQLRVQNGHAPAKLNTVIQPLMAGLRREADALVREAVASAVARLVILCTDRTPSPNDRHVALGLAFASSCRAYLDTRRQCPGKV